MITRIPMMATPRAVSAAVQITSPQIVQINVRTHLKTHSLNGVQVTKVVLSSRISSGPKNHQQNVTFYLTLEIIPQML